MVEINNQRAFLDMLPRSEELITTPENQKSWL